MARRGRSRNFFFPADSNRVFSPRGPPKLLSRIIINWISRDEGLFVARSVRLSARTGSQGENLRTYLEIPFISKTDGLLLLARRELVFHQSAIHSCGVHNCLHRKSHLLTNFVTCPQQFPRIIPRARSSSSVFHFRTVLCHFSNENWPNPPLSTVPSQKSARQSVSLFFRYFPLLQPESLHRTVGLRDIPGIEASTSLRGFRSTLITFRAFLQFI